MSSKGWLRQNVLLKPTNKLLIYKQTAVSAFNEYLNKIKHLFTLMYSDSVKSKSETKNKAAAFYLNVTEWSHFTKIS